MTKKQFLKIIITAAAVIAIFIIGIRIRHIFFDREIEALRAKADSLTAAAENMKNNMSLSDEQSKNDALYLDVLFKDIFNFTSIEEFEDAKINASSYGLSNRFVNSFYDTTELTGAYAEEMLNIYCSYESSDLYLLDRYDDTGYYYAVVTLKTVNLRSSEIKLALFIALQDSGDNRVSSIVYYYAE